VILIVLTVYFGGQYILQQELIKSLPPAITTEKSITPAVEDNPGPTAKEPRHGEEEHTDPHQPSTESIEQGGHWSDAYLPPLEERKKQYANDPEALLVINNTEVLRKHGLHSDHPEAAAARTEIFFFFEDLFKKTNFMNPKEFDRFKELKKLSWPMFDEPRGTHADLSQW
jgi:hypothetical protein